MTINISFEESVQDLFPRDIRNICGEITDQKYNKYFMYHERNAPPILYLRPYINKVQIVFVKVDFFAIQNLIDNLEKIKKNFFGRKIKKISTIEREYNPPFYVGEQRIKYTTRTPILLSANKVEYQMNHAFRLNNKEKEYIHKRIVSCLEYQLKEYIGIKQDFSNLKLDFDFYKIFMEKYKEGENKVALIANFTSNYKLPLSIGISTGMGYGELFENDYRQDLKYN